MNIDFNRTRVHRKPAPSRKRRSLQSLLPIISIAGLVLLVGAIIIRYNDDSCSGGCTGSPELALCQLGMAEAAYHQRFGSYADFDQLIAKRAEFKEPHCTLIDFGFMVAQCTNSGGTFDIHCGCKSGWLRPERRYTSHYNLVMGQRNRDSFYILALPTPDSSQQTRYYLDESQSIYSDDENKSSPLPGQDYHGAAPPRFVLAGFEPSQKNEPGC